MKYFLVDESEVYNKTVIIENAERKLKEINAAKRILERECEQIGAEVKLLENGRLLEVSKEFSDYLSTLEIEIIYGMEWLSNNGRSLQENKKIVENNPFIPYSIILSGADFDRLAQDNKKIFTSTPIPIVKREELEDGFIESGIGTIELDKVSFYLMFRDELLDTKKRGDIIWQKKEKITKIQENIKRRDIEYGEYFSKCECIKKQSLEKDSIELSANMIMTYEKEINDAQNQIEELENLKRDIIKNNENINQKITDLNRNKSLADFETAGF